MATTYLINICPSRALGLKALIEVWSDHPTNYGDLKAFGRIAYVYMKQ